MGRIVKRGVVLAILLIIIISGSIVFAVERQKKSNVIFTTPTGHMYEFIYDENRKQFDYVLRGGFLPPREQQDFAEQFSKRQVSYETGLVALDGATKAFRDSKATVDGKPINEVLNQQTTPPPNVANNLAPAPNSQSDKVQPITVIGTGPIEGSIMTEDRQIYELVDGKTKDGKYAYKPEETRPVLVPIATVTSPVTTAIPEVDGYTKDGNILLKGGTEVAVHNGVATIGGVGYTVGEEVIPASLLPVKSTGEEGKSPPSRVPKSSDSPSPRNVAAEVKSDEAPAEPPKETKVGQTSIDWHELQRLKQEAEDKEKRLYEASQAKIEAEKNHKDLNDKKSEVDKAISELSREYSVLAGEASEARKKANAGALSTEYGRLADAADKKEAEAKAKSDELNAQITRAEQLNTDLKKAETTLNDARSAYQESFKLASMANVDFDAKIKLPPTAQFTTNIGGKDYEFGYDGNTINSVKVGKESFGISDGKLQSSIYSVEVDEQGNKIYYVGDQKLDPKDKDHAGSLKNAQTAFKNVDPAVVKSASQLKPVDPNKPELGFAVKEDGENIKLAEYSDGSYLTLATGAGKKNNENEYVICKNGKCEEAGYFDMVRMQPGGAEQFFGYGNLNWLQSVAGIAAAAHKNWETGAVISQLVGPIWWADSETAKTTREWFTAKGLSQSLAQKVCEQPDIPASILTVEAPAGLGDIVIASVNAQRSTAINLENGSTLTLPSGKDVEVNKSTTVYLYTISYQINVPVFKKSPNPLSLDFNLQLSSKDGKPFTNLFENFVSVEEGQSNSTIIIQYSTQNWDDKACLTFRQDTFYGNKISDICNAIVEIENPTPVGLNAEEALTVPKLNRNFLAFE